MERDSKANAGREPLSPKVKAVCFYLPQFHPVKENDEWWGPGFTEWRNVTKAVPNFVGHYQPHLPADLGFYDLRLVEVQKKQAELARQYGIHGFCYHYYWFNGRRILERPLEQIQAHPEIDFPFCVCWANENWSRTWDGGANHILLPQNHNLKDDEAFIRALLPLFRDPRYIKVDGKPMLVVYRVDLFPDAKATAALWRSIAMSEGFPDLHLCAVQFWGIKDPRGFGFDAAVEFPPHHYIGPENVPDQMPQVTSPRFRGTILDYQKVVAQALQREMPEYRIYRGVMPSWDNTARRQDTPHLFVNDTPFDYRLWLQGITEQTVQHQPPEERFVFINAWNEWAEGCHLEPDMRRGHAWLEATRSAITGADDAVSLVLGKSLVLPEADVRALSEKLESQERALIALQGELRKKDLRIQAQTQFLNEQNGSISFQSFLRLKRLVNRGLDKSPNLKERVKAIVRKTWVKRS